MKKNKKSSLKKILVTLSILFPIALCSQDCLLYLQGNYGGTPISLNIGDSSIILGAHDNMSFKLSNGAALLVKANGDVYSELENWDAIYKNMYFYSEELELPHIIGTDQWSNGNYSKWIYCTERLNLEPPIYIPIDLRNAHKGSVLDLDEIIIPDSNTEYVFLNRAYFWENSEQLNCDLDAPPFFGIDPHGPAGDIKINICHPSIINYPLWVLGAHPHLWGARSDCTINCNGVYSISNCGLPPNYGPTDVCNYYNAQNGDILTLSQKLLKSYTLLGPIFFSPPACDGIDIFGNHQYAPSPHNEWSDGPWGTYYSNFPLIDWSENIYDGLDSVAILITEADKGDWWIFTWSNYSDVLGSGIIKRSDAHKLIKIGMSGWVILEKYMHNNNTSAEITDYYWYPNWESSIQDLVLGPLAKHERNKHLFKENLIQYIGCNDNDDQLCLSFTYFNGEKKVHSFYNGEFSVPFVQKTYIQVDQNNMPVDTLYKYVVCIHENQCPYQDSIQITPIIVNYPVVDSIYIYLSPSEGLLFPPITPDLSSSISVDNPGDNEVGPFTYRANGTQYNPFSTIYEVESIAEKLDSIGVLSGTIPSNNELKKELTYLPLDKRYSNDKSIIEANLSSNQATMYNIVSNNPQIDFFIYPNPTTDGGTIFFKIDEDFASVKIQIINQFGTINNTIIDGQFNRGVYNVYIDKRDLLYGINFIRLISNNEQITKRIILLK
ncbi:MAG: T9SS type A sorting domain-containing protein [Saprospiraceae bacterium]|nr:T9SS type A sorting domain-containing protein [Saprospiraceae bacterium]